MVDREDDGWKNDPLRNETRYKLILEGSRLGALALVWAAVREDPALVLPRLLLLSFGTALRIPRALALPRGPVRLAYARRVLAAWSSGICRVADVRLELRGLERLDPAGSYLFACNHASPFDPPVAHAALPVPASFVCNAALADIPVFGFWLRCSESILVSQGDSDSENGAFRRMIATLRSGVSLVLFPEGYIHQGKGLAPFKRGGLNAAVLSGVPIVPMIVLGSPRVFRAGSLSVSPHQRVLVEFLEPIDPRGLPRQEKGRVDELVRDRMIEAKARLEAEGGWD